MIYAVSGFLFGLLIPYIARRFAKFMPATPGYALYRLIMPVKRVGCTMRKNNAAYRRLIKAYLMRSIGWAIVCAALSYAVFAVFNSAGVWWRIALVWILLVLYEIDERMLLLPDILTVPLLITGFVYNSLLGCMPETFSYPALSSSLGAAAGYVLPVLASLFLVRKYPEAFGGGDIKLLAASGAWLGFEAVPYLILLSSAVFAVMSAIKRQKAGAFGPAIVIATLTLVFFHF